MMRRGLFCLFMLSTFSAHADIRDASKVDEAAMASVWVQALNEVDTAGMATIWRDVINGDEGLVIKTVLIGKMAAQISEKTGSPGPYHAAVSRVKKYSEPGCARIRVVYLFPAAKTVNGVPSDININYEQDFCLDGHIPRETLDLSAFPKK